MNKLDGLSELLRLLFRKGSEPGELHGDRLVIYIGKEGSGRCGDDRSEKGMRGFIGPC